MRFGDEPWTLEDVQAAKRENPDEKIRIDRGAIPGRVDAAATGRAASELDELGALLYASTGTGRYCHIENAVLFEPSTGLYAVVSGHTRSEAMSQAEYDWKVHSVGAPLRGEVTAGEFESDRHRQGWRDWVIEDLIDYGDGAVYAVKPARGGVEIVIDDRGVGGLEGDRFTIELTAGD